MPELDKVVHLATFAALAFTGLRVGLAARWWLPLLVVHAVTSEIVQDRLLSRRSGDPLDVLADLAGVLAGTLLARASWGSDRSATPEATLTGRLLVATPALGDSNFERSVVLVLDHDEDGALGVVINRPTPLDGRRGAAGLAAAGDRTRSPVPGRPGGPGLGAGAGPGAGVTARRSRWAGGGSSAGSAWSTWTRPPRCWRPRSAGCASSPGYAGWGAGQLEDELAEGAWYVVDARFGTAGDDPGDPFTSEPEDLWRAVLRRQGGDLAMVSTYLDDPSLN